MLTYVAVGAHDGAAYTTLYCDGGITLKFPREAPLDQGGYISLDWIAGERCRLPAHLTRYFSLLPSVCMHMHVSMYMDMDMCMLMYMHMCMCT